MLRYTDDRMTGEASDGGVSRRFWESGNADFISRVDIETTCLNCSIRSNSFTDNESNDVMCLEN